MTPNKKHDCVLSVRAPGALGDHLDKLASEAGERRSSLIRSLLVAAAHARQPADPSSEPVVVPGFLLGLARAALERTADPVENLIRDYHQGTLGLHSAADVAQLGAGSAAILGLAPEMAIAAGAGVGMQGISEALGASRNTARLLGSGAEIVSGLGAARAVGTRFPAEGKAVAQEARSCMHVTTTGMGAD